MYILVDCNQFFVSCEKVFQPKLEGKPVVVLSNNDGCVISRSQEAKAIGIPMGAPYFKCKELIQRHKVHIFSSNYSLYGDLSHRVMQTLASFGEEMEVYSIDEAFLSREGKDHLDFCKQVHTRVKQWTGIPISIGIGPTKTLAKVANELAKKSGDIVAVSALDPCLKKLPVEDVWGIGRKTTSALHKLGIYTAEQLALADNDWIRKHFTVTGLRIALELRGTPCRGMDQTDSSKKGIVHSRSFGKSVFDLKHLEESVASYAANAAEKMRSQGSAASYMQVYLVAKSSDSKYYLSTKSGFTSFKEPLSHTPELIEHAKKIVRELYRENTPYKKTAVFLGGLVPFENKELDLFSNCTTEERLKQERLMALLDTMNQKKERLFFLAEGIEKPWKMKRSLVSPAYTTSWQELPKVKAN